MDGRTAAKHGFIAELTEDCFIQAARITIQR
jgi:hypothetical protein